MIHKLGAPVPPPPTLGTPPPGYICISFICILMEYINDPYIGSLHPPPSVLPSLRHDILVNVLANVVTI